MKIKETIAKALRGETLNALERAELESFDPEALQQKIDELERAKLTREEALQHDLDAAQAERDALRTERDTLRRRNRIDAIARESGCENAEFLDFLAAKDNIDLEDGKAVAEFVARAERGNPAIFRSRLRPGSGGATAQGTPTENRSASRPDRIGAIVEALDGVPEAE